MERRDDQWWFWTEEWQAMEREAAADIAAGRGIRYESTEEFLASLIEQQGYVPLWGHG